MSEYYICLIDLLGQKEFFAEIKSGNLSEAQSERIRRTSSGLREMVNYVENRYKHDFLKEDDVGIELFSDSLILTFKVSDNNHRLSQWLQLICKLVYISLRHKLPLRGIITDGYAQRTSGGTIYGKAVQKAFELESKVVDYPRVVIEKTLGNKLLNDELLAKFVDVDIDSGVILNYASERLLRSLEFSKEIHLLDEIVGFVGSEFERFCNEKDDDADGQSVVLARRYHMWLNYLHIQWGRIYNE